MFKNLIKWVAKLGFGVAFIAYITSMIVYPLYVGGWGNLQSTLYTWQSLNVGILAFSSTVILFYVSTISSRDKELQNLKACRAMLVLALSNLSEFLEQSVDLLLKMNQHGDGRYYIGNMELKDFKDFPILESYNLDLIKECIKFAKKDDAAHLASLLTFFQIFKARYKFFFSTVSFHDYDYKITKVYRDAGELKAVIDATFGYARLWRDNIETVDRDLIVTAHKNLNIPEHVTIELLGTIN